MSRLSSLSLFFPAYNDAAALPELIGKAFHYAAQCAEDFEVIVVNDASPDNTDEVLEELRRIHGDRLRVVRHQQNQGYGGALMSGFRAATKEFIFYTDGDAQYDMADLPSLAVLMGPTVGLVNGYKTSRQDVWYRRLLGMTYLFTVRHLFWLKIRDVDCDFRIIRRSVMDAIELRISSGAICVELVRKIQQTGCGVIETPVRHLPRLHGKSQFFRWRNLWRMVRDDGRLFVTLMVLREPVRAVTVWTEPAK